MRLVYFQDPGHGWVKAPRALVNKLGIADKISSYSYQRGDAVYLEEDCDATLLVQALKAQFVKHEIVSQHTNKQSRIRNYESYRVA